MKFAISLRSLRTRIARKIARATFHFCERYFDIHVTANDYYSPIPSVKDLASPVYENPFSMAGVSMNEQAQIELLAGAFAKYSLEYTPTKNGGLSLADAYILFAMIRERKPRKMIEIGGGDSTLIAMQAVEMNRAEGYPCHFTCIEPYPRDFLLKSNWPDYELIIDLVQNVPVSHFVDADIVFIDSSHVCKIGSDVNYEILELVPHTPVGCLIHWHDIVIPTNYWRDWTTSSGQFWNESYLLHAFLLFNSSFAVKWASRYMQLRHAIDLKKRFPYLTEDHRLTSFWVERVA